MMLKNSQKDLIMTSLQKALSEQLHSMPQLFIEKHLQKKIRSAGEELPPQIIKKVAQHILSGNKDSFVWDGLDRNLSLDFSDADADQIIKDLEEFVENGLPKLVKNITDQGAKTIVGELKARWPEQKTFQDMETFAFRERLELRWHKPMNLLRITLTVARDIGAEKAKKYRRSKSSKNFCRRLALLRLHARACQVTAEIITLLEAGYSDGAFSRWRTLHEIGVIALLISDHGEELAERYLAHEVVDVKQGLDDYIKTQVPLGAPAPSSRTVKRIGRQLDHALAKYGADFGKRYGWAANALKQKMVTFGALEKAAGRSAARSKYKMASLNVHTNPRSLTLPLTSLNGTDAFLAGASNAGLDEPGRNTAYDIVVITTTLFDAKWTLDNLINLSVLARLRDATEKEFVRGARKLLKEDTALRTRPKERIWRSR
jgi:hypothetical protein